jgi:hypothetical protein
VRKCAYDNFNIEIRSETRFRQRWLSSVSLDLMAQSHSSVPEPWSTTDEPALDWLYNTGSVAQALAYSELFWPRFTEHDDCVFLLLDLEKYESWMKTLGHNKTQTEATLNYRHIADLFEDAQSASHEWLIALGRTLKQCWAAKLRLDFPHRRFEVQFDETFAADATDYEITFYQQR